MKKYLIYMSFVLMLHLLSYFSAFSQFEYIENKGQWHENVLYKLNLGDGAMFLERNCVTWAFVQSEGHGHSAAHHGAEGGGYKTVKNAHCYKVYFRKANPNPKIFGENPAIDYENYFLSNDQSKWASNVLKYSKINYSELYPAIDLIYYRTDIGLKYDFVLHPGSNYKSIDMEYDGAEMLFVENGNLVISTSVNVLREQKPFAFQVYDNDTVEVSCNYVLKKNRLSFEFPNGYNQTKDLIIDPSLVFSTYTGSTGDNWGFTATWDYDDNVYSGGIVFSIGYPVSSGAYQATFAGGTAPIAGSSYYGDGCDVGIIKYNQNGTQKLFATYLGGANGQEMPHSLVVNELNELVIMGTTGSPDFPVTPGAFQTYFAGGDSVVYDNVIGFHNGVDIFVSKLSENGTQLLASTYIGGSDNDGLNFKRYYTYPDPVSGLHFVEMHGNDSLYYNYGDGARGEVIVDDKNMIYVGTNTFSLDFPAGLNPGFQASSGGGQDGIVCKFNSDLTQLVWSSYLGGNKDDAIFSLSLSNEEDVLVSGGTVSHNFPVTTGAYNTAHNGGSTDAFVSKLNRNGNILMASTYFGSSSYENSYFVRTDRFDNVFICGQTKAPSTALIHNALYNVPNSGQFITKFNPSLNSVVWSTRFGTGNGRPNISITAFAVDVCDRVYLSGWGREWARSYYNSQGEYYTWESVYGTKGMAVTPDAIQTVTDGQDFYVLVLNEDASNLEYASFFGEVHYAGCGYSGHDHVDGGTSRFDKKGHIIQSVCASCGGCQQFPTSPNPGVWSTSNNASNCNNAVFKIRIIENLAQANFDPLPAGCAPYTVSFNNTSQGSSFVWNFGDGSPTSSSLNPSHTYTSGGEYTVSLIVGDPLSCNFYDTIQRVITVIEPGQNFLSDIQICSGASTIIGPQGTYPYGTTFQWSQGTNLNNYAIKNPVASPIATTDYLLIAAGICIDSLWQTVVVYEPDFDLYVFSDTTICPGGTATLYANSTGTVNNWEWSNSYTFNPLLSSSQNLIVSPSISTTYYVRAKENICNTFLVESVLVNIHSFNYNISPTQLLCPGETINLSVNNQQSSDVLTYQWGPASQIISGANTSSPQVGPSVPTTYYVTITNQMGCTTTNEVQVNIDNITWASPQIIDNLCFGYCQGSASVTATGVPPYTYLWSNGNNTSTASNLCEQTYTVTVTDGNDCTSTLDLLIDAPPQLLVNFTDIISPQCDGVGYGSATIVATGGTAPYSYNWQFGGNQALNTSCLVGTNIVSVTDNNGCQTVESVFMLSPSTLTSSISLFETISCYGFCDGSMSVQASLGLPPYTYNWSNGAHGLTVSNLCAGPYTVTIVDAENCVSHQYLYITQPTPLLSSIELSEPIKCFDETGRIKVNSSGGTIPYSYSWSNGASTDELDDIPQGSYLVNVNDANNCTSTSSITLTQPPKLLMDTTIRNMLCDRVCNGQILTFVSGGTPPYYYNWSNGSINTNALSLCAGDYELEMTDYNGCSIIKDFTIINEGYVPDLAVSASPLVIYNGEQVNLLAYSTQSGTYSWNNSSVLNNDDIPNPIATPTDTTMFQVRFRDENGCVNIDSIKIIVKEVICGDPYLYVPNAFTPNFDGNNDYFKPFFPITLVTEMYFAVYDRWGAIIYETSDMSSKGWDGTYKGEKLPTDVFVFWFFAKCLNGEEYSHKGNVTLLR